MSGDILPLSPYAFMPWTVATLPSTQKPLCILAERHHLASFSLLSLTTYRNSEVTLKKKSCRSPILVLYISIHLTYDNTGCPRRNEQNFGRVFLILNYTDITQNTYIQSWTVTEIMAIEKCGLLGCPRTVRRPWRHTHPLRMPGNERPLANIGMQRPWRYNAQLRPA